MTPSKMTVGERFLVVAVTVTTLAVLGALVVRFASTIPSARIGVYVAALVAGFVMGPFITGRDP